ncbi:MAG: hypothetical protein WAW61_22340 [Methylococcaceae bacterium]
MATPHPHAALIHKWADDTSLKFQYSSNCGSWFDCTGRPDWCASNEYRIKPEVIRYRVGSQELPGGKKTIFMSIDGSCDPMRNGFIEWKTDWIEVEI